MTTAGVANIACDLRPGAGQDEGQREERQTEYALNESTSETPGTAAMGGRGKGIRGVLGSG